MKNELLKQWQQDVEDYGDNAYLMYEVEVANDNHSFYVPMTDNGDFEVYFDIKRKQSAELPFDLKRAKSGDDVQWVANDELFEPFDVKFVNIWSEDKNSPYFNMANIIYHDSYERVRFDDLRMKYPSKMNK